MHNSLLFVLLLLPAVIVGIQSEWQPSFYQQSPFSGGGSDFFSSGGETASYESEHQAAAPNQCELYKVGMIQDLYFQYIQYKIEMPELKEFTLCFWSKFTNHSNDHPMFSYAVDDQPRAIYSWVSNTERSSYFSMAVEGHTFFRLNYPLRLNKWYHTCQSWNGKTGEWQIWVNAERVGRGFHNRLVGHTVPGGGVALTGQEQTQKGGGFFEGKDAPQGAGGLLGEVTMLQLYSVALTAGKAHRDHKHHHAHQFDHNGNQITTPPPTTPVPRSQLPTHPLLTAGQINPMIRLNFAGGQPNQPQPQVVAGQNFNAQYLNGQFVGSLVTQQFQQQQQQQATPQQQADAQIFAQSLFPSQASSSGGEFTTSFSGNLGNPANVQFIDRPNLQLETHNLFKRHSSEESEKPKFGDKLTTIKKKVEEPSSSSSSKTHSKRELQFLSGGTILEDGGLQISSPNFNFDESLLYGLAGVGQNEPVLQQQKQYDEREPAEAEVKAVMNVCNGCDEEPFGKALIIEWRNVPKKLYSGAFYTPAAPHCKAF